MLPMEPAPLIAALRQRLRPSKDLGQHFLTDPQILSQACDNAGLPQYDENHDGFKVLEIGAGPGVLSTHIISRSQHLTAIEVDPFAISHLETLFSEYISCGKLKIVAGDALRVKWPEAINKIIANIPYGITSPLLGRIDEHYGVLSNNSNRPTCLLLIQKEVADRLSKKAVSKSRSSLAMTLRLGWDVECLDKVSKTKFDPQPAVDGRFIRLSPIENRAGNSTIRLAKRLIRSGYSMRRKRLSNALRQRPPRHLNRIEGWDTRDWQTILTRATEGDEERLSLRAEVLSCEDWIELSSYFEKVKSLLNDEPTVT